MKIICIEQSRATYTKAQNTSEHNVPIFFLKPETSLIKGNKPFFKPDFSDHIYCRINAVYKICRVGKHISEKFAPRYYGTITAGIDFTAIDLQQQCKEKQQPWEIAKSFDSSAPLSEKYIDINKLPEKNISLKLEKNGILVQKSNTDEMQFSINRIIAYISKYITLKIGDLIFAGTPVETTKIEAGDTLTAYINEELMLTTKIH